MLRVSSVKDLGDELVPEALVMYPSLRDLVQEGQERMQGGRRDVPASRRTGNHDWSWTHTFQEATELALYGWADGTGRIANLSERIAEKVSRRLPHHGMTMAEEGGEVDVAAYLNGDRECMWDWRDDGNRRPVVRVSVNIAASSHVSAETYVSLGAVAAATIDALEASGRRVELDVYEAVHPLDNKKKTLTFGWRLKDADQPLDLGALAYAVAHPSMLRRTLFSVQELTPIVWNQVYGFGFSGGGYGTPAELPEELRGDLHLELAGTRRFGAEEGYDWVLARLREQGVEVASS